MAASSRSCDAGKITQDMRIGTKNRTPSRMPEPCLEPWSGPAWRLLCRLARHFREQPGQPLGRGVADPAFGDQPGDKPVGRDVEGRVAARSAVGRDLYRGDPTGLA